MYSAIWRLLPGPLWLRLLLALLLLAGAVLALFEWVFPVIAPYMPFYAGGAEVG